VAYLQLGSETFKTVVDEETPEAIEWEGMTDDVARRRRARLPRVIFVR
jgi:hypothetical protein